MRSRGTGEACRRRESGATAIEFALLFPMLFAVAYGGITYGVLFFLQQRVNFAAQEGVRAAIAVAPSASNYKAQIATVVSQAITLTYTGGGGSVPAGLQTPTINYSNNDTVVSVTVTYNLATTPPLFPTVTLPVIGAVPAVPPTLSATATGRLS